LALDGRGPVARRAAGESINLQVCNILFNTDIPWNPNRLEQRMGRILRYGQPEDCFWLYVVTNCDTAPKFQEPIRDPARLDWNEVTQVAHDDLSVNAMTRLMQVRGDKPPYGGES